MTGSLVDVAYIFKIFKELEANLLILNASQVVFVVVALDREIPVEVAC